MSSRASVASAGEHALLARLTARIPSPPAFVQVGIGDDAAVVAPPRNASEVFTTDALVDGVHVDRAIVSARAIGWKALAVNLSDLASMGAAPRLALLSLGLPPDLSVEDFDALVDGFLELAGQHGVSLVGGNLTRTSGPLFADVTAVGSVRPRRLLRRAGGRPGDELYVSGTTGAAAAGLAWLRRGTGAVGEHAAAVAAAVARYSTPEPRVRLGGMVGRSRAASACMDTSDGVADAVTQLAQASGLGADVDAEALPLDAAVALLGGSEDEALRLASGSDDYELLFAVSRRRVKAFKAAAKQAGTVVTRIGALTKEPGIRLLRAGSEQPWAAGYQHFGA